MSINSQTIIVGIKKFPLLILAGLVSVALAITIYLRSDLLVEQQAELDKKSAESTKHRANVSNSAQLPEHLEFLMQANNAVRDRTLNANSLAQNLQYFYKLEAEVGVKYTDLRPGPRDVLSANKGPYVPLNYALNVSGDFPRLITFLRRLEQGVYFCRINTATLNGSSSGVTLSLDLDLLGTP